MTKIDAIIKLLEDNGGVADWKTIYDNIEKYYPAAKQSREWQAGLRGVLLRELARGRTFKRIGVSVYALENYREVKPDTRDQLRMHSFIEGICLELGNFKEYATYTADPSAIFRDGIKLENLTTLKKMPAFTYPEIVTQVRNIDVVWFNVGEFKFPRRVFEVVDSAGTLIDAFNRSLQLLEFRTEYFIVAPQKHKERYDKKIRLAPYSEKQDKFKFINYEDIIRLYENTVKTEKLESDIFN